MRQIGKFFFNAGERVICTIKDVTVHGKIYYSDYDNQYWICHDNPDFNGSRSPEMFGFNYSWTFYVDEYGIYSDEVGNIQPMVQGIEFKNVTISDSLSNFNKMMCSYNLSMFFSVKCGIFGDYIRFCESNVEGNIIMETKPRGLFKAKKVEIKLSRFIRQVSSKLHLLSDMYPNLSDKQIEEIHNKFVSFQKGTIVEVEFLSGDDIKEGYNHENYFGGNSTLHKSCMTDVFDALGIYTNNPEQVRLAVIKFEGKIACRTFVWNTIDGGVYHDRIYYAQDWMEPLMSDLLQKSGITFIGKESFKVVQLKEWKFKRNPYIDNFYNLDGKTGQLLYMGNSITTLRSAGQEINWD